MYLLDTNIWLERLLNQEHSDEVGLLLTEVPSGQLLMTDFSSHSVGVILHRLDRLPAFVRFVQDLFVNGSVGLLALRPEDLQRLTAVAEAFDLDFDDANQYLAAEEYGASLVGYDRDFDRTERRRLTPAQVLDIRKGVEPQRGG